MSNITRLIQEAKDAGRSIREQARLLHKHWDQQGRTPVRGPASLAKEFTKAHKGDDGWFRRTAEASPSIIPALAQVYEVDEWDLGLEADDNLWPFHDFRELRSIDLRTDEPFAAEMWRGLLERSRAQAVWMVAPPGAGRSLAARYLSRRYRIPVVQVDTLSQSLPSGPVIVDFDGDAALASQVSVTLGGRVGVLVLATLPPGIEQVGDESSPAWRVEHWQPPRGWRRAFVSWLAGRLDADEIEARLLDAVEKFDPGGAVLLTPGDVVQFCASAYSARRPSAREFVRVRVDTAKLPARERAWLSVKAWPAWQALLAAAWRDAALALGAPRPWSRWAAALTPSFVAPAEAKVLEARVRAAIASKRGPREIASEIAADGAISVGFLRRARLLRAMDADAGALSPRWAMLVELRRQLREGLPSEPGAWCAAALTQERREILDAVLDELDARTFTRFVERASGAGEDLAGCAIVEAAFAAIARRLERDPPLVGDFSEVARRQVSLLAARFDRLPPGPRTRPGPGDWVQGGVHFVADCWRFSLAQPRLEVPAGLEWLFPGWTRELPTPPAWLRALGSEPHPGARVLSRWRLGSTFLELRDRCSLNGELPEWALEVAIATGQVYPAGLHELLARNDALPYLVADAHPDLPRLAREVWADTAQANIDAVTRLLGGPLGALLLAHLPSLDWLDDRRPPWAREAAFDISRVPAALASLVVPHALVAYPEEAVRHLRGQIMELGPESVDVLLALSTYGHGFIAVQRTWQVAPDVARDRATSELEAAAGDSSRWVVEAPPEATSILLDIVASRVAPPFPEWLRCWAMRRVLFCPGEVGRLLDIVGPPSPPPARKVQTKHVRPR